MDDPWTWLRGRTPSGAWRHVAASAERLGDGQDPGLEPRVELIRRLIAYPPRAFGLAVEAVAAAERPEREARWLCYRQPGQEPARPYWLCFVSALPHGRRFHLGLELFDRERLGVWFFSGYRPEAVPPALLAPFPGQAELLLPRLELRDGDLDGPRLRAWIQAAWEDRLTLTGAGEPVATPPRPDPSGSADQSHFIGASLVGLAPDSDHPLVGLKAARARLLVWPEDGPPVLHPVARLTTVVGRDPHCEVLLEDRRVSAEHARLTWREGRPMLEDLGSKNGTRVAGRAIAPGQPCPLEGEVTLSLGGVPALFVSDPPEGQDPQGPRLAALVRRGRLSAAEAEGATSEAAARGITPGEVLLAARRLTLAEWEAPAGGGCGGAAALAFLALLLLAGPAAWLLLRG